MKKSLDVFFKMQCLDESGNFKGTAIKKKWFKSTDKRYILQYLHKFIHYNERMFNFLQVEPFLTGSDHESSIAFRSSSFIGAVPLRASDTGKQIGDFIVTPRYSNEKNAHDYIEILELLGRSINPEVIDSLPLVSGNNFRPPLYLEALKYIASLETVLQKHWRKFDNIEKISDQPLGQVNWDRYGKYSYRVERQLQFPIRKNILSEYHTEFSELRYVYDICKNELQSANTPPRIKSAILPRLTYLDEKLYFHQPKYTNKIAIKFADPLSVIACKENANTVLNANYTESTAWRVDFTDVYEKFVQYIIKEMAKEIGGKVITNPRFISKNSNNYAWALRYVEPDAVYVNETLTLFIDAKYKSHLFNKDSRSEQLKDDHRRDLHQIMAYSSFSSSSSKFSMLCYPSSTIEIGTMVYRNLLNDVDSKIFIIGIPFQKSVIGEAKKRIGEELKKIKNVV